MNYLLLWSLHVLLTHFNCDSRDWQAAGSDPAYSAASGWQRWRGGGGGRARRRRCGEAHTSGKGEWESMHKHAGEREDKRKSEARSARAASES